MNWKIMAGWVLLSASVAGAAGTNLWERYEKRAISLWPSGSAAEFADGPRLVPVLLPGTQQPAPAVLICDGVCSGKIPPADEVIRMAGWLNARNVHAFVLCGGSAAVSDSDIRRAVRLVRNRSAEWQVDDNSVGVLGMALGEMLVAKAVLNPRTDCDVSDKIDQQKAEPDFAVLIESADCSELFPIPKGERPLLFIMVRATASDGHGRIEQFCKEYGQGQEKAPVMHFGQGDDWKEPLSLWLEQFKQPIFDF